MKVIAQRKGGPSYLVWEAEGTPGPFDGVVIVRVGSDESFRYRLGAFLGCRLWEPPSDDAPAAKDLLAGASITDYMWLTHRE